MNQHKSETRDFDWWQTTFQDAVREIGCTVLVLSPWERPIPLTRSWCIWEVFSTLVTGANLEVVMSDTERYLDVLQTDFERIMKELCQLDAEHAKAGQKRDEEQINATILQHGGFAEVNSRCQMGIQGALADIARHAVTEDSFKLMDGLGRLLEGQAKYDEALTWYEKALAGFVEKGEEENTATTYYNMASVYTHKGEYTKSLVYFNLGALYHNMKDYKTSLENLELALAIYLKSFGPNHPQISSVKSWIADVKEEM